MPRLQNDPNLNICPDFASPDFADARAQLTNDGMAEEQSIILLRTVWEATNNSAKLQWQAQVEIDKEQHDVLQRRNQEEQDKKEWQRLEEEEAAHKEERKRNKHKYTPIQDCGVPIEGSIVPSSYATRKLEKGEFVELWYFTNEGLGEAHSKKTIDDDAMIMSKLLDGSTAWVSAASMRNARSVVDESMTKTSPSRASVKPPLVSSLP
ncbi:hypothetical protein M405DRAFT_901876 [Rhizopogon salebrosus TDB-379]|nr:hypothetical protein M405DRAFT_901876 [Rhizopogon salebrosus TDB-379]